MVYSFSQILFHKLLAKNINARTWDSGILQGSIWKMLNAGIKMPDFGVYMPISKYQFDKTLLAFKRPQSGILITNIGI